MAEIRIKKSQSTPIKTLNRTENIAKHIRTGVTIADKQSENTAQSQEDSFNSQNAESFEGDVKEVGRQTAHYSGKAARKVVNKGTEKAKEKISDASQRFRQQRAEKSVRQTQSSTRSATQTARSVQEANTKAVRTKASESAKQAIKDNAKRASKKAVKTAGKQSVKTAKHGIRTAQQTAKASIKTSKEAAKAAQKAAKAAAKAARKAVQAARAAAKAAAKAAKIIAKIIVKIIQAIIAAIKGLIAAIASGGWVAVLVIVIIVMIALILASVFGIFYSGEDSGTGMTMRTAITEINDEYNQEISDIKTANTYDVLDMSGTRAEWKDVLAVYAAKMNMNPDNPEEVVTMDESKKQKFKDIFWDMHEISHNVTSETVSSSSSSSSSTSATEAEETIRTLHILVTHKTPDEMAAEYRFSQDQIDSMHELLDDRNNSLWSALLHGIISSNSDIVEVARSQLGNVGGQPYWSWYGFSSRVDWCCIFVSWCANECGYIDEGIIPKYSVVDDGVNWFKDKGQWLDGNEEPLPGMIIFFDWADDGLNGSGDHTGIVEKVENGIVYTIEGNSGDACKEHQYSVGNYQILGYGFYESNSSSGGSGDVASQVWTRLKSYGYSDSVAAGIIGNMMRECGGDTLDLDWDTVGHYNGDEFYGLCQWCLSYTPPGFKGSTVIAQCDYLKQTIQSAFANYGGNYGGITYIEFLQSDTRTAAIAFERVYERCGDYANEDNRRANNAERAYNYFH